MFHVFSDKRSQQFKEQLYRAQRKQESKQKESKRKMNDRERQQCLEDIETIKRLSAEKEALLIQKSLNQVKNDFNFICCLFCLKYIQWSLQIRQLQIRALIALFVSKSENLQIRQCVLFG